MINIDYPIIGSHNTMTYLKPKNWIGKIFRFMTKCQKMTYKDQYFMYDVRAFDLRIYFDDEGKCYFKHGLVWFEKCSLIEILSFFNKMGDCYVRILLEETKSDSKSANIKFIESKFKSLCKIIEELYFNVKFIGGERKFDWKKLYSFKYEEEHGWPSSKDLYSSTTCLFDSSRQGKHKLIDYIDDWCPWIYAKIMNKKNFKEYYQKRDDLKMFWMDFVDIR